MASSSVYHTPHGDRQPVLEQAKEHVRFTAMNTPTEQAMKISLRQAVERFNVSRPTLTKALKSGKISGEKDDSGAWSVEPSELARLYEPRLTAEQPEHGKEHVHEHRSSSHDYSYMKGKVEALEEQIEDLKAQRDRAEARASQSDARLYGLLEDMRGHKRSWWQRLRGQ